MPVENQYGFGQGLVEAFPIAVNSLFKLRDQALQKEQFGLEQAKFDYLKEQAEQDRQDKLAQLQANSTPRFGGVTTTTAPNQGQLTSIPDMQPSPAPTGGQGVLNAAALYGGNYQSGTEEAERLARDYKIFEEAFKAGDQKTVNAIAPYLKTSQGQPYVDLPYANIATGEAPPSGSITSYNPETGQTTAPITIPATTRQYSTLMSQPKTLEELMAKLMTKEGTPLETVIGADLERKTAATLSRGTELEAREKRQEGLRIEKALGDANMRLHQGYLKEWNKLQGQTAEQNKLTAQYYDELTALDGYYRGLARQIGWDMGPPVKGVGMTSGTATAVSKSPFTILEVQQRNTGGR